MGLGCEITEGHTLIKLTSKTIGILEDGREEERDTVPLKKINRENVPLQSG